MGYEFYRHSQAKYKALFIFPTAGGINLLLLEFFPA
jgi:hypothetical protein